MQSATTSITQEPVSKVPLLCLLAIVIQADLLLWSVAPGLGVVLTFVGIAAGVHFVHHSTIPRHRANKAWILLGVSLIPAIELVQALSLLLALLGLGAFVAIILDFPLARTGGVLCRLLLFAVPQVANDIAATAARHRTTGRAASLGYLRDWVMPLGLGLVFLSLFVIANPVLGHWFEAVVSGRLPVIPSLDRLIFWAGLSLLVWPFLRLAMLKSRLTAAPWPIPRRARGVLVNERSVTRALVLFNLLFAIQTLSDLAILTGGVALPDGITYASYAHQGAYPLVVTALLAGVFGVVAQPHLGGRPILRLLLIFWVAQNVMLVATSAMRLDLYVDVYGLTRLRFAAFVWMAVVATGLVLMIWQILRALPVSWMLHRAALVGIAALYLSSLTNVAGLVARHNLADHASVRDSYFLCTLGEGAVPAIAAHEIATGERLCYSVVPQIRAPEDWREWGYRNARLRSSLAALQKGIG